MQRSTDCPGGRCNPNNPAGEQEIEKTSFHAPTLRGGAIRLENARHCRIAGNRFDQAVGDGVRLQDACEDNEVVDNEIAYAGGQGISISSSQTSGNTNNWRDTEQLARLSAQKPRAVRNVISNNHVHHCGLVEKHGAGIVVWGINSVDNVISHNLIHHIPRHGIAAQDGFGRLIIEYNELHDLSLEGADCGGIFSNRWYVIAEDEDQRQHIRPSREATRKGMKFKGVMVGELPEELQWTPMYVRGPDDEERTQRRAYPPPELRLPVIKVVDRDSLGPNATNETVRALFEKLEEGDDSMPHVEQIDLSDVFRTGSLWPCYRMGRGYVCSTTRITICRESPGVVPAMHHPVSVPWPPCCVPLIKVSTGRGGARSRTAIRSLMWATACGRRCRRRSEATGVAIGCTGHT